LGALTNESVASELSIAIAGECMNLYMYRLLEQNLARNDLAHRLRDGTIGWDELRESLDLEELQKRLSHDNAGAKALSWLLQADQHEQLESTFEINFLQAAAWCTVGESKTDFWWDLMTIRHVPKFLGDIAVSETRYSRMRWQKVLFRSLFDAQLFWSGGNGSFNAILATFAEVLRLNATKKSTEEHITLVGAHSWLSVRLPFDLSPRERRAINVDHWDAYTTFTWRYYQSNIHQKLYQTSILDLTHPIDQKVDSSLQFYRLAETSRERMQYVQTIAGGRLLLVCKHLAYQCYRQGRAADARWAIGFYRMVRELKREGGLSEGDEWDRFEKTYRQPTNNELAKGVSVDAHGRVVSFKFRETLEEAKERERKLASKVCPPFAKTLHSREVITDDS
jgi:hypothetical protein